MTTFRKSVPRPEAGSGAPKPKNSIVKLIYAEDIASFPPSDENGVLMQGSIVLKDGAKTHTLYLTDESQKASHSIEGDADAEGFLKKVEATHPGDSLEINEFVQNSIGQGVIIILDTECGSSRRKVVGTPCNPLYLKGEFVDDKDAVKHTLNFEQRKRDRNVAKFYDGELQFEENFVAANALAITVAHGYAYKLPVSDAADTDITVASMTLASRKIITLIGSGGLEPSTLSGGVTGPVTVLLENATPWVALKDAIINLLVVDAGATTYLIELSRK